MGKRYIVAIAAVILVGLGVKLYAPAAEADVRAVTGVSMDVSHMHEGKNLPVQKFDDMTFVFSDAH